MSRTPLFLILCAVAFAACSRAPTLDSRWRQADIVVDGTDAEWPQTRYVLQEQVQVTLGLLNDTSDLYLCAVTADRDLQRRILFSGLEVWLDPQGGSDKRLGLRLPPLDRAALGGDDETRRDLLPGQTNLPGGRRLPGTGSGGPGGAELSPERLAALFATWEAHAEVRLVDGKSDKGTRLQPSAADPLQVRVHYSQGRLVLEARVPLVYRGTPGYEVRPGQRLGLALRVPEPPLPAGGPGRRGDGMGDGTMPGASLSGVGGREAGRYDGDGGRRRPVPLEPLQQWLRVTLSAGGPTRPEARP